MVVTLAAAGYVSFVSIKTKLSGIRQSGFALRALHHGKQVAQTNWDSFRATSNSSSLRRETKSGKFAQAHASEKPDDAPCTDCDLLAGLQHAGRCGWD